MTGKKLNISLWHGNDLNEDGSAKAPSVASYAGALDGLNPGELYICDADGAPTLFMVTDGGRVVPIGGVNSEELKKLFIRKDTNDRTPFKLEVGDKLTAEKGLQISKNFVSGIIGGSGGYIYLDENGKVVIETDKAVFREELIVPQITFNCIDVISGDKANTFAYGTIKTVDTENRIATLDLLEGQYGTLHVSDICRGIFHNIGGGNTDKDTIGANGFIEYSGFATSYFTPTNILENEAGNMKFEYELQVGTNIHPMPGMNFFAYGNFKDKDRQAITYENRYYTRRLAHVNTWVIDPEVNVMMQTGDLSGLSIGGMDFSGYSFYGKNVYISGTIERLKPNGTPAKDLSYEGVWESGRKYDYYDSVTHDGSTWACMNKDGSSAEPGTNNDWQKIASKGDKGDPGESAVFADLTNEMDNVTLTNDGKVYQDTSISTVVWMSYGTKKMTLTGITCTLPANVTETHDVSTGEITFSVKQGVALDGRNPIPVALTATYNGKAYTGQLTFTLAGVKGGADAVLYRLVPSVSAVIKDANGNLNVTSVSCTRLKSSVSGGTAETGTGELKYSLDGGAEVSIGNNAGVPVSSFQKSIKFIFYVDGTVVDVETIPLVVDGKDGAQGPQGVPGPAGADGKTLYTWIKYADDAQGGGISNNPTGKAYIGFAYNKETATESNDPSDYTWSDIKGEDGIPGDAGADGKTYYTWVAYSDNADGTGMYQQPKDTTKYIGIAVNKETATESNNPSDYTWSKFKGEDGQSVSSLGRWHTGLIVPKQGVVTMGGSSYIAKKETTNPPLWTVTTSSGQRIKQTQDGGKTYGYILSGEMNSAEYDLLASKGEDGKPGADGKPGEKGEQGIQGCIIRHSEWAVGVTYRNDEALTSGTRYVDIAMIRNNAAIDGWDVYKCNTTHTSSESNKPGVSSSTWTKLSGVGPIYTSLIIAKNASIDFMQGNQLLIKKDDGTVTAGLSGSIAGSKVRIWAGSATPDDAPFRVLESGKMIGTDVELTGTINAISGTIAGFKISGTSISSTDGAYDGGAGNNSYSNSKFFLHADGSSSAFLGFSATNKWVGIGLNCMPATSSMQVLGRFEDTGTSSYTYNKAGLYISIAGATTYDDSNVHGNSALYIPKGHITGFRRRFRRVSTSTTLTNMDSIVRLVNTAEITVTLPAGCEDGQEIWLCSGNEKKVNVAAASGDTITGRGGSFASNRWHIYIYDAHNRDWVYGYTNYN